MKPDLVAPIVEKVGVDWMANVGGFIHSDPDGTMAGALKMRKAIDTL
jgi:ribulose 1,5-bisphosphate carboxylase large subunit-like protein